jgi:hypothetical protein
MPVFWSRNGGPVKVDAVDNDPVTGSLLGVQVDDGVPYSTTNEKELQYLRSTFNVALVERPGNIQYTNLVPNPSFELDTANWQLESGGGIPTSGSGRVALYPASGSYSMKVITTAAVAGSYFRINWPPASRIPVTAGVAYSFRASAYVEASSPTSYMAPQIDWYNSSGVASTSGGVGTAPGATGRLDLSMANVVAPAGAVFAAPNCVNWVGSSTGTGTISHYLDAVLFAASSVVPPYFDGSTPGAQYQWTGTPGSSTSVKLI